MPLQKDNGSIGEGNHMYSAKRTSLQDKIYNRITDPYQHLGSSTTPLSNRQPTRSAPLGALYPFLFVRTFAECHVPALRMRPIL